MMELDRQIAMIALDRINNTIYFDTTNDKHINKIWCLVGRGTELVQKKNTDSTLIWKIGDHMAWRLEEFIEEHPNYKKDKILSEIVLNIREGITDIMDRVDADRIKGLSEADLYARDLNEYLLIN